MSVQLKTDGAAPGVARLSPAPLRPRTRSRAVVLGVLAVIAATAAWMYRQSTVLVLDDARFVADPVTLASPCDCAVSAVLGNEGARVSAGSVVLTLDGDELPFALAEAQARVDGAEASVDRLRQEVALMQGDAHRQAMRSAADMASADDAMHLGRATLDLAERKLARGQVLLAERLIARGDFERIEAEVLEARRAFSEAHAGADTARIDQGRGHERAIAVAARQAELRERQADMRALQARVAQLRAQLRRRRLVAPFDAVVDRVFVRAGDRVLAGRRLMLVHDPRTGYVEANVPETELRYLHPGKPVSLSVDAYPDRVLDGVVTAVGTATTSQFGLLPSTAPAGSFVKVVQRVPVRIRGRFPRGMTRPGMQVEVRLERGDG